MVRGSCSTPSNTETCSSQLMQLLSMFTVALVSLHLLQLVHTSVDFDDDNGDGNSVRQPRAMLTKPTELEYMLGRRGEAELQLAFYVTDVDICDEMLLTVKKKLASKAAFSHVLTGRDAIATAFPPETDGQEFDQYLDIGEAWRDAGGTSQLVIRLQFMGCQGFPDGTADDSVEIEIAECSGNITLPLTLRDETLEVACAATNVDHTPTHPLFDSNNPGPDPGRCFGGACYGEFDGDADHVHESTAGFGIQSNAMNMADAVGEKARREAISIIYPSNGVRVSTNDGRVPVRIYIGGVLSPTSPVSGDIALERGGTSPNVRPPQRAQAQVLLLVNSLVHSRHNIVVDDENRRHELKTTLSYGYQSVQVVIRDIGVSPTITFKVEPVFADWRKAIDSCMDEAFFDLGHRLCQGSLVPLPPINTAETIEAAREQSPPLVPLPSQLCSSALLTSMVSSVRRTLVTFATDEMSVSARWLASTALSIGGIDNIRIQTPRDLDDAFVQRNLKLLQHRRGFGFWVWKPYVFLSALLDASDGEIVMYADAGSSFGASAHPLFTKTLSSDVGMLSFIEDENNIEHSYTKRDTFIISNCDDDKYWRSPQRWASYVIARASESSRKFAKEWLALAQDPRALTDAPNELGDNIEPFIGHRHDQSIYSLLCKRWGIDGLPGESMKELMFGHKQRVYNSEATRFLSVEVEALRPLAKPM